MDASGGYIRKDEDLDEGIRLLKERAGVTVSYLEEFGVLGKRTDEFYFEDFDETLFQKQRFITIGFYALYNATALHPVADEMSETCEWIYLSELPGIELAMDHREIIEKALLTLRKNID
jgi:ADP-ribose pyrophosphatase YjhB (NUDIX family)